LPLALVAWLILSAQPVAAAPRCGSDRWPVKTLTDLDRAQVSMDPISTSIGVLAAIPIPEVPYPANHRLAPYELTTYRVRGRLLARMIERDQDIHLVLQDVESDATFIVEVPAAACALGSPLQDTSDAVRATALAAPLHSLLTVTGVGFFDFLHEARGQAPNGFELHPVVSVVFEQMPSQPSR
jgi:hypothetical protein